MSLHDDALATLERWAAPDGDQETLRARFVAHLRRHEDGLWRSGRPDHVTASTLVVSAEHREVLLTLHAKARRWFQLGGHCEPGDATLAGAAHREAREESGIGGLDLDPVPVELSEHAVPFCGRNDAGSGPDAGEPGAGRPVHHLDVRFVAVTAAGGPGRASEESLDLRWWPVEALPPGGDIAGLVTRALERLGHEPAQSPTWSSGGGSTCAAADQPSR